MSNTVKILLLVFVFALLSGGLFFFSRKRKNERKAIAPPSPEPKPDPHLLTQIQMRAEGDKFSTLFGISKILEQTPGILSSLGGILKDLKHQKNQTLPASDCVASKTAQYTPIYGPVQAQMQAIQECNS